MMAMMKMIPAFNECLLCVGHVVSTLLINPFKSLQQSFQVGNIIIWFYRWRNWDTKRSPIANELQCWHFDPAILIVDLLSYAVIGIWLGILVIVLFSLSE